MFSAAIKYKNLLVFNAFYSSNYFLSFIASYPSLSSPAFTATLGSCSLAKILQFEKLVSKVIVLFIAFLPIYKLIILPSPKLLVNGSNNKK